LLFFKDKQIVLLVKRVIVKVDQLFSAKAKEKLVGRKAKAVAHVKKEQSECLLDGKEGDETISMYFFLKLINLIKKSKIID
jgi:hypothetical protein